MYLQMYIFYEHDAVQNKMYGHTKFLYSVYKYTILLHTYRATVRINILYFYMHKEINPFLHQNIDIKKYTDTQLCITVLYK